MLEKTNSFTKRFLESTKINPNLNEEVWDRSLKVFYDRTERMRTIYENN